MSHFNNDKLPKTVNIPNLLYQSSKGRYFVGQTETIHLGQRKNAWGALINPTHSNINLHVNAFTITNHSNEPIIAEIWFNPIPPGNAHISKKVTPANLAYTPTPIPKVDIAFADLVRGFPKRGVNAFNRIVPPQSTLTSDEDGKFIFAASESFVIFLISPKRSKNLIEAEIAFGWYEK